MTAFECATAIREFAGARHYSASTLDRWLALSPHDGTAVLEVARALRLSEHQLCDLWDWAEDIARRDRSTLAQVLHAEDLLTAQCSPLGRNDQLKRVKAVLRRRRFPALAALEERIALLIRELGLPPGVRLTVPKHLEGNCVHIEIVADSPARLHAAAVRLAAVAETAECAQLFEWLAEAP